jgi:outer membrane lipoprotein-sorting protein
MKKIFLSAAIMGASLFSFGQDVTVDEILDNYFENTGGREAWNELEGHKMSAEVDQQGMVIPIDVYEMKDDRTITKINFQGMEIAQGAFDGDVLWSTNFMSMKAEKADAEATENMKRNLGNYPNPFLNYKDLGYSVELMGNEDVDGVDCFKIKLTMNPTLVEGEETENVQFYYFDTENFVPIRMDSEITSGQMKGQMAITELSDYQEVDGLYFPFSLTMRSEDGPGQTIEFDTIELNPEVTDDLFKFPGGEETLEEAIESEEKQK